LSFRRGPSRNPGIKNGSSPRLPGEGREPGINKYWMPVCTGMTDSGGIPACFVPLFPFAALLKKVQGSRLIKQFMVDSL